MIAFAGSVLVMSCLGCATAPAGDGVGASARDTAENAAESTRAIEINAGPIEGFQASAPNLADVRFPEIAGLDVRLPLRVGDAFGPATLARPETLAVFKVLDLSTPRPVQAANSEDWSGEVAFGASGRHTGLGVDFQVAPRARIRSSATGDNIANFGGEVRVGQGFLARDQRHTNSRPPSWYVFLGADNQALVWNLADKQSLSGVALRDQVTVGDMQAGLAWRTSFGGQTSLGLVQRKFKFNDPTGDHDVSRRENFAALSFTLKR